MQVFKGLKDFLLRGNLVELAVAVAVGVAFSAVIMAFVKDLITPLIGIFGGFSVPSWSFTINRSLFQVGDFLTSLISFLLISLVIFFFVLRPLAALLDAMKQHEKPADPDTCVCPFCRNEIPIKATRCGFCTSDVAGAPAASIAAETEL